MTIKLRRLSRVDLDGEVAHIDLDSPATEIIGPRNSGKTTILRIMDYVLGEGDSASKALGEDVAARYSSLTLDLVLAGVPHQVERRPNDYGYSAKIFLDGEEAPRDSFSPWILTSLGWPVVDIPKARSPKFANATVPLSFRTLLRHLYRREDSWSDFAYREDEFHRRAVLRYFLGVLDVEGDLGEFEAARSERVVAESTARFEEANESAGSALRAVAGRLSLEISDWDQVDGAIADLEGRIESLREERSQTTSEIGSLDNYNAELTHAYESLSQEITDAADAQGDIEAVLRSFRQSSEVVNAEIARLERANSALDVFADVPVQQCPACGQDVSHLEGEHGHCFLCRQTVTDDQRKRRIDLEIRSLRDEASELVDQIERTGQELTSLAEQLESVQGDRAEVASRITDERSALLAPYVGRLEQLSAEEATHAQAIAALLGLRSILTNVERLREQAAEARKRQQQIALANIERNSNAELTSDRCQQFAGWMTSFLNSLEVEPWGFGPVTMRPDDMEFILKGHPWKEHLGGETKISFFLAYHYALLKLSELDAPEVRAPGLVILDNPIQQAVPDGAVAEALSLLESCAVTTNGSVISAFARSLPTHVDGKRVVRLNHVYGTDSEESEYGSDPRPEGEV